MQLNNNNHDCTFFYIKSRWVLLIFVFIEDMGIVDYRERETRIQDSVVSYESKNCLLLSVSQDTSNNNNYTSCKYPRIRNNTQGRREKEFRSGYYIIHFLVDTIMMVAVCITIKQLYDFKFNTRLEITNNNKKSIYFGQYILQPELSHSDLKSTQNIGRTHNYMLLLGFSVIQ